MGKLNLLALLLMVCLRTRPENRDSIFVSFQALNAHRRKFRPAHDAGESMELQALRYRALIDSARKYC